MTNTNHGVRLQSMGSATCADQLHLAVGTINEQLTAAFNQHDTATIASHFTEDGQLLPPYSNAITGRHAICAFWQGAFDMGINSIERQIIEVGGRDDIAYEVGTYVLRGNDGQRLDDGAYLVIWKWEEGRWRCHRDIWNTHLVG